MFLLDNLKFLLSFHKLMIFILSGSRAVAIKFLHSSTLVKLLCDANLTTAAQAAFRGGDNPV